MDIVRRRKETDWGFTEYCGSVPVNASSSGANVLLSGSAVLVPDDPRPYAIVVFGYPFVLSGDVQLAFTASDGTVLSGPVDMLANSGMAMPESPLGHFITPRGGQGISLLLGAAVHVGGHLKFGLVQRA